MELPTPILFNTLSGKKEPLVPRTAGEVSLYVCGPTVYSYVHIGNARTFTAFDVVVRFLRYLGYRVRYVRNYTDVDDKIIAASNSLGESAQQVAERFMAAFREDASALKLVEPDVSPRVSENIPEIVALIKRLVDAGVAYESQGDVYFQVARYPSYAKLSRKNLDDLRAGERVVLGEQKREPLDFALWKAAKPHEPFWESPWGKGRPGWHIECSAMSTRFLGENFDLHGGGIDLIFPHHDNEIAQSEAASEQTFCRYWMHCNFLDLEGAKMSKSLGNVVRLRDALGKVDAEALRSFFLSTHYRSPLSFNDKSLHDAETRMEYFYETLRKVDARLSGSPPSDGPLHGDPHQYLREFEAALLDDFNWAGGMAAVSGLFNAINELCDKPPVKDRALVVRTLSALREDVRKIASILGLFEEDPSAWLLRRRERRAKEKGIEEGAVEALIRARKAAREAKDFAQADALRNQAKEMGVELLDTPAGTTWKVV